MFSNDWLDENRMSFISTPYLPPVNKKKHYTLVLDLDETLIHFKENDEFSGEFFVRPYAEEFISNCAEYYEIVIFTAAL